MDRSVNFGERLSEERKRKGLNQTDFAALGGVTVKTQVLYEKSERAPDAHYLGAMAREGVDVLYVLLGEPSANALEPDEAMLLRCWRTLDQRARAGILGLMNGLGDPAAQPGGAARAGKRLKD